MTPPGRPAAGPLATATAALAVAGGALALAAALLVCTSVLGRWLLDRPVPGDFELVKMATAVAVFAFLPHTQTRRANIVVDSLTGGLGARARAGLDALWDITYAAVAALIAWQLVIGTGEMLRNGETTMELQLPAWPAIGIGAVLCGILALTALLTGLRLLAGRA